MKYTISLFSPDFIQNLDCLPPAEILVHPLRFSRYGRLPASSLIDVASKLKELGHRPILCIDAMMRENETDAWAALIDKKGIDNFSAFRFTDPGVGSLVKEILPKSPLQQNLERSTMNTFSARHWENEFQPELLALSPQITLDMLKDFRKALNVKLELLCIGPLEIFHSARLLLDASGRETADAVAQSIERPSSLNSRLIQTPSGTTMFYERYLFLQPMVEQLVEAGVDSLRYDLIDDDMWRAYLDGRGDSLAYEGSSEAFGPTTRAFIKANRTDAQFSRLINSHARNAGSAKAKVLQYVRPECLMLEFFSDCSLPMQFKFVAPDGYETEARLEQLTDIHGQATQSPCAGQIYSSPWIKRAISGTVLVETEPCLDNNCIPFQ